MYGGMFRYDSWVKLTMTVVYHTDSVVSLYIRRTGYKNDADTMTRNYTNLSQKTKRAEKGTK